MKVLLDENLPQQLRRLLTGHEVMTVPQMGWAGTSNGELLDLAEARGFDVFVTADQNLQYQQNFSKRNIACVVLVAKGNQMSHFDPLVPAILEALRTVPAGEVVLVSARMQ